MTELNRRKFVVTSTQAAATAAVVPALVACASKSSAAVAANEKLTLGFIGCGGRAGSHLAGFGAREDCEIAAVCDVNSDRLAAARRQIKERTGKEPDAYVDMRKLLEDKSIDAVVISTPDHWHCLASIWACQAGKDVYVEKPVSNNPWEGRQLVNAARRYNRVVQVGTQNRSAAYNLKAKEYIDSGKLGDVTLVRVYNQKYFPPVKLGADSPAPATLDWDLWQGPAPARPFNQDRFRRWDEFWDYGGGDVTDDTVHQLDLACMLVGISNYPKSVYSCGFKREGSDSQMPDTIATTFQFDRKVLVFNQTLDTPYMLKTDGGIRDGDIIPYWPQNATRIEIFGTKGLMFVGRHGGGWEVYGRPKSREPVVLQRQFGRFPDSEHREDFVRCVRTREKPNADVELGHYSAALCHYTNISFRVGNKFLEIDPETERFSNDEAANALLRPEYRKPFVIPDKV